jgi:hypothetical protein
MATAQLGNTRNIVAFLVAFYHHSEFALGLHLQPPAAGSLPRDRASP